LSFSWLWGQTVEKSSPAGKKIDSLVHSVPIIFIEVCCLLQGSAISKVTPLKTPSAKSEQLGTFWVLAHQLPAQEESWCLACQHLRRSIILSWTLPDTRGMRKQNRLPAVPLCLLKSFRPGTTQTTQKPHICCRF